MASSFRALYGNAGGLDMIGGNSFNVKPPRLEPEDLRR